MRIQPARRIRGRLRLPGDKSISHRAAIISALACGSSSISNFSTSGDCASTLACLRQLGVSVERDGTSVRIEGAGSTGSLPRAPSMPLDCGNSGSTMRLLAGVLAGQDFVSELTGDASLRSRPMKRVIEPLEMMGAQVRSEAGRAPLLIKGRKPLQPITYEMVVASAQVKSCILLAGLNASGSTTVREKTGATRDHTERLLGWFGAPLELKTEHQDGAPLNVITINGPAQFSARDVAVPGDISSAAFFMAAAALLPGSRLEISEVGFNRTRSAIVPALATLGADVRVDELGAECNEMVATIHVTGGDSLTSLEGEMPVTLHGHVIPQLIDELPVLAVVGTQVQGGLAIRDAAELRVKESDRIRTTVENLRAMGAEVEEYEDGLFVAGKTRLQGARLNAHGDHRIAMALTIAALIAEGESEITGAECVGVSFPEFFRLLASVTER